MSNKICVAGWHFFDKVYKKIEASGSDIHVVAHRYREVLDRRDIEYSITKNVGLEFGVYDWYLKNIWDGNSNVVFMHDDIIIDKKFDFKDFFKLCEGLDYVIFRNSSKVSGGGRCIYLSSNLLSLLVKEFKGIWYDPNDRGYIWGEHALYDDIYYELGDKKIWRDKLGKHFKITVAHLIEKHKLKKKDIICNKISLCVRGGGKRGYSKLMKVNPYRLSDHSILGSSESNVLSNDISIDGSAREIEGYYKWYDFYFSNIRFENLNILEIGLSDIRHLNLWKDYFVNSDVRGINRTSATEGFLVDRVSNTKFGVNIIIDTGEHKADRISLFEKLFKEMAPGGIYVLENLRKDNNIVDYFKDKIDAVNFNGEFLDKSYEKIVYDNNKDIGSFEKRIASIHFYMGMCFIFKRYCK